MLATAELKNEGTAECPACRGGAAVWTGRVLSTLLVLFLLFDAVCKVLKLSFVVEASGPLGIPEWTIRGIGVALLVSTILYAVPRTAVLGAILLTGYLGGAIETHVRTGGPAFNVIFAGMFGVLAWVALALREPRIWTLVPLRTRRV